MSISFIFEMSTRGSFRRLSLHHFANTVRILSPLVAVLTSDGHWLNGCACSTSNFHRPVGVDLNEGTVDSGQDSDKVQKDIDAPGHPSHKGNMISILII